MSFNPGWASAVDDKNVFVPEETNRVELDTEIVLPLNDGKSVVADSKSVVADSKSVKVAVYTMIDEDDGVGQLLRKELLRDKRVLYAAYRIPHRQEALMKLRFHVPTDVDPQVVLDDCLERCIQNINNVTLALENSSTTS